MLGLKSTHVSKRSSEAVSTPENSSYRPILWRFQAARSMLLITVSPWYLTGPSAAVMPSGLPNFRAIGQFKTYPLQWRHNERDGVSEHWRLGCLFNRLFWCTSKKTSKLRVSGLCEGNPPVTGGFPSQRTSYTENVSVWWHYRISLRYLYDAMQDIETAPLDSHTDYQSHCVWIIHLLCVCFSR